MAKQQNSKTSPLIREFNMARWGLLAGIGAITLSSAFMNVSGWVSMAATAQQATANAMLSGGMELTALFSLPYAGFMMRRKSYGKALLAFSIAAVAISTNIYATQNFLHFQADTLINSIELSGAELSQIDAQITGLEREVESIITQNGGTIPRDVETVEQAYSHFDPEQNPVNMRNRDAELGARERYDALQEQLKSLRAERAAPSVEANDISRAIIPAQHMKLFVSALELMKATGLYILGNSTMFLGAKARKAYENRKKWALIRKKQMLRPS